MKHEIINAEIVRIGNFTIAPNNGGWTVFDWTIDQDIRWFKIRYSAIRYAHKHAKVVK